MGARKLSPQNETPDLEIIFKESLRILRSRTWAGLGASLAFSVQNLLGRGAEVEVWIAEEMIRDNSAPGSFLLTTNVESAVRPQSEPAASLKKQKGLHIHVQKTATRTPLLWLRIGGLTKGTQLPSSFEKIWTALTPSILSACDLIQFIAGEREKTRLENDLKTAEIVQRTLIPGSDIERPGVKIAASYRSALECGGDWWGVYRLTDTRSLILLGDVTGHGTASALVSAMVKGYSDAATRHPNFNLKTFFEELNEDLYILGHGETCLSFLALVIDADKSEIEVMNAGHPAVLKIAAENFAISALYGEIGPILGFDEKLPAHLQPKIYRLEPGTHWVLYTDGLTESLNQDGQILGEGRLLRALKRLPLEGPLSGALIRARLLQVQADWLYGHKPDDDTTLLILSF